MARIRSVHPGLFTDEAFAAVSMASRVLFIGLWCEADDLGVFEWKALTLKMRLFPGDAVDVPSMLSELAARDMIRAFDHEGKQYGAIRNFGRYQRPKSPKVIHPHPAELSSFLACDGRGVAGPLNHPRDVTAAERKRRERDNRRSGHASAVTHSECDTEEPGRFPPFSEVSRQMEEGGGNSVANATGVAAPASPSAVSAPPVDWRERLFRQGLASVSEMTGKPVGPARSLIGRWLRVASDDARKVLRTIEDAQEQNAADPVAWIEAALKARPAQRSDSLQFTMARG